MKNSLGPWGTALNVGPNPQLSAFWKKRMAMLVPASRSSRRLSWPSALCLIVAAVLTSALPTLRDSSAFAEKDPEAADVAGTGQGDSTPPKTGATAADKDDAANETEATGASAFRLFDGFDGKLALDWEVLRPDPTHVSLEKNPGKLTITTQRGSIWAGLGPSARNVYLIRNPVAEGGDFVLTTCIESFEPTMRYHQAGLLIYDDDDNYIKYNKEQGWSGVAFSGAQETAGKPTFWVYRLGVEEKRVWLRITKRGRTYERAYSTDGKEFVSAGSGIWGNGAPKWIGVMAKNGLSGAADIDAVFDFFESRSLTGAEKDNARLRERQKLQGAWDVVSCQIDGRAVEIPRFSRFVFDGASVTVEEKTESFETMFALDVTKKPKKLTLFAPPNREKGPTNGVYSLKGDTLVICLALQPNASVPAELETTEGDGRLLITLQRTSEDEAAATERPRKNQVQDEESS